MAIVQTSHRVDNSSRRHRHRLLLLLLVIVPFIPEIVIGATIALAYLMGCQLEQKEVCLIGAVPVSQLIGFALKATAGFIVAQAASLKFIVGLYLAITGWQVVCYVVLSHGWSRAWSRLLIGFLLAVLCAILPYFGLTIVTSYLENENCPPANEGGYGSCQAFGDYIGGTDYNPIHDAGQLGWLALIGAPLAFGIFAVFAVLVIVAAVRSTKPRIRAS